MDWTNNPYLVAVLVALLVFVLYMTVDALLNRGHQERRLDEMEADDHGFLPEEAVSLEARYSSTTEGLQLALKMLGCNLDTALPEMAQRCAMAGLDTNNTPTTVLFFKRIVGPLIAIIGGIMAFTALTGGAETDLGNLFVGGILLLIGLKGADLYITNATQKRQHKLLRSFPDSLDLLVVCVESGLALGSALARVCKELGRAYPDITKELNRTRVELALLNDRPQALFNLADRTNLIPFRSLVAALIQTEKFGTSLTDTLRVLSEDYRLTRLMQAEEKAGRLPVLMTIPLILLLMPAFTIIILAPPFIRVAENGGLFGSAAQ